MPATDPSPDHDAARETPDSDRDGHPDSDRDGHPDSDRDGHPDNDRDGHADSDRDVAVGRDANADGDRDGDDARAARAREEAMTVHALRDDRYAVETAGGSYRVDLLAGRCTCPDHAIRGALCKHLRRVAIEVTAGRVAPPGHRRAACAVCGDPVFVPVGDGPALNRVADADDVGGDGAEARLGDDATGNGAEVESPALCETHCHAVGDLVRDRETGKLLVVVGPSGVRADVATAAGLPIREFPTNAHYGDHEPVVPAVYVESLRRGVGVGDARRYDFPASRLRATSSHLAGVAAAVSADGGGVDAAFSA